MKKLLVLALLNVAVLAGCDDPGAACGPGTVLDVAGTTCIPAGVDGGDSCGEFTERVDEKCVGNDPTKICPPPNLVYNAQSKRCWRSSYHHSPQVRSLPVP